MGRKGGVESGREVRFLTHFGLESGAVCKGGGLVWRRLKEEEGGGIGVEVG